MSLAFVQESGVYCNDYVLCFATLLHLDFRTESGLPCKGFCLEKGVQIQSRPEACQPVLQGINGHKKSNVSEMCEGCCVRRPAETLAFAVRNWKN